MKLLRLVPILFAALSVAPAQDDAEPERRPFCRYVSTDDGGKLEVLIATYRRGEQLVTLLGALHVADAEYYHDLQQRFRKFDRLLYELIGPKGMRPYPDMPTGGSHWIGAVQDGMGSGLKLAAQFDCLDYRMDNFVHADMTEGEWQRALRAAGSSEVGELMSGAFDSPSEDQPKPLEVDLVDAFRKGRGTAELRIMMAQTLCTSEGVSDEPTVIIEGRNERCLEVLREQLDDGHEQLGIFYGAAHLEHMERRLLEDMGFARVAEEWVMAWDCSYSKFPKVEKGLKRKIWRAKRDLKKLQSLVDEWCEAHAGEQPTWAKLRKDAKNGKLPGRKDGVDEWGREYVLVEVADRSYVICVGSDGEPGTDDDVTLDDAPGSDLISKWRQLKANQADWRAKYERASADLHRQGKRAPMASGSQDAEQLQDVLKAHEDTRASLDELFQRAELRNEALQRDNERLARNPSSERARAEIHALQYAVDLWLAKLPHGTPTLAKLRDLHPRGALPVGEHANDPWGKDYAMQRVGSGWVVRSAGPDGKFDTADDL